MAAAAPIGPVADGGRAGGRPCSQAVRRMRHLLWCLGGVFRWIGKVGPAEISMTTRSKTDCGQSGLTGMALRRVMEGGSVRSFIRNSPDAFFHWHASLYDQPRASAAMMRLSFRCGGRRFKEESEKHPCARVGWCLKADVALRRISSSSFMACKRHHKTLPNNGNIAQCSLKTSSSP